MSKRFISSLLMALFFVTAMGVFTSCKDYDDDIARLEEQLDANKKTFDQINSLITDGSVITKVEKVGNGIEITLSNGQKYTITNGTDATVWTIGEDGYWYQNGTKTEYYALGKDGTNGKDGKDAIQWTIGADGYWYQDGVKTNVKAEGTDGTNGAEWTIGTDGYWYKNGVKTNWKAVGKDGKDGTSGSTGGYYRPNENGYFDFCDSEGKVIEPNAVKITSNAPNGVTAVMDDGELKLYGVEGVDNYVTIALSNALRNFVFVPEGKEAVGHNLSSAGYVDGVPAIFIDQFGYKALKISGTGEKETYAEIGSKVVINPPTYVYYHVNPKNANWNDLKKAGVKFVVRANSDFVVSRKAPASPDFNVTAALDENYGIDSEGLIRVKVNVTGTPATNEKISVVALQTTKKNGEDVTSDYATVYKRDLGDIRIAARITEANKANYVQDVAVNTTNNRGKADYHYRRWIATLDPEAGIPNYKCWYNEDDEVKSVDIYKYYDKDAARANNGRDIYPLNLNEYVMTHLLPKECLNVDMDRFGLKFVFEKLVYRVNGPSDTDEDEYIDLSNEGVVTVKAAYTSSAINRTPIIRVKLMHGNNVVKYAYIKLKIKEPDPIPADPLFFTIDLGAKDFACGMTRLKVKYEDMSKYVYKALNMSKRQFHETYNWSAVYEDAQIDANGLTNKLTKPALCDPGTKGLAGMDANGNPRGTAETIEGEDPTEEGTHVLTWVLNENQMWERKGNTIYIHHYYKHNAGGADVYVTLKMKINPLDELKLGIANKIDNYWNNSNNQNWVPGNHPDKSIASYSVRIPNYNETNPANCEFFSDLNSPFRTKTVTQNGVTTQMINFDVAGNLRGLQMKYVYQFSDELYATTMQGASGSTYTMSVKHFVNTNGQEVSQLIAKKGAVSEVVAQIVNENTEKDVDNHDAWPYSLRVFKTSEFAKDLLNTNKWLSNITLTAYVCGDSNHKIYVQFVDAAGNVKPYYTALFMRPVFIDQYPEETFQDGVDFGQEGSYIDLFDLLNPYDWRSYLKTPRTRNFADYNNYWFYYGLPKEGVGSTVTTPYGKYDFISGPKANSEDKAFLITLVNSDIKVNYDNNASGPFENLKETIYVTQVGNRLYYRNNDVVLTKDMMLRVRFDIHYGWGTLPYEYVYITVKKTPAVQAPRR